MYLKKNEKYLIELLSVSLYDTIGILILKQKIGSKNVFNN
jgi:hypothetical protein